MTREEHIERHKLLHQKLDELLADFITHTDSRLGKVTILDLMKWTHDQTFNPTETIEGHTVGPIGPGPREWSLKFFLNSLQNGEHPSFEIESGPSLGYNKKVKVREILE